jgi:hypothetical protein
LKGASSGRKVSDVDGPAAREIRPADGPAKAAEPSVSNTSAASLDRAMPIGQKPASDLSWAYTGNIEASEGAAFISSFMQSALPARGCG